MLARSTCTESRSREGGPAARTHAGQLACVQPVADRELKAPREIADDEWPILGERRWECWNLELVPIANALVVLLGREHQREHAVLDQRLAMRAPERAREH